MKTETKSGIVRRVFFCNPESPFMAGVLATNDGTEVRFSGKVAASSGDLLEVTGAWVQHPKFGRQFEVQTGIVKMDESPNALIHLLANDKRFRGLGPARAKKVVEAALSLSDDGDITQALLDYTDEVAQRANVKPDIVKNVAELWRSKRSYFNALAGLAEQGWTNAQAQSIVKQLGDNAAAMVGDDPYMLIGRIPRFGFKTVDVVALKMGVEPSDPSRLCYGVSYCLDRIGQDGHTWTPRADLLIAASKELKPNTIDAEDRIVDALDALIRDGSIVAHALPMYGEVLADARVADMEITAIGKLVRAMGYDDDSLGESFAIPLFETQHEEGYHELRAKLATLNAGQAAALESFGHNACSIISGAAGTGKTYTMDAICSMAEHHRLRVVLCAPTGKAARKLSQATNRQAKTIHRLLEPRHDPARGFVFTRDRDNPIEADVVIVDEFSMVDIRLLSKLLAAVPKKARIVLVGDHNQIPSVGAGAILRDLLSLLSSPLASERISSVPAITILSEIVRQAGVLALNTKAVLDGIVVQQETPAWGVQRIEEHHDERVPSTVKLLTESILTAPTPLEPFGRFLDPVWDIQVLAPQRKGALGTYALNVELQRLRQRMLGNPPPEPTKPDMPPKILQGDRVIWIENDYQLGLFNGTLAIVTRMLSNGELEIQTEDGQKVTVPAGKRNRLEVAYAMTIHKSQGSEWPCVIVVASSKHFYMHDSNLLYTAVSRASESVTLVGDLKGMMSFAKKKKSEKRQTFGAFVAQGWKPSAVTHSPVDVLSMSSDDLIKSARKNG